MCPEQNVTYVSGMDKKVDGRGDKIRTCDLHHPIEEIAGENAIYCISGRLFPSQSSSLN